MAEYTDEGIQSKVEISTTRWIALALIIAFVTFFSCVTYSCADSRAKDYATTQEQNRVTSSQRVECVRAGGSWMPIQAVQNNGNNYPVPVYEMGCVSASNALAVMAQNKQILDNYKPEK